MQFRLKPGLQLPRRSTVPSRLHSVPVVDRLAAVVTAFEDAESHARDRRAAVVERHTAITIVEHAAVDVPEEYLPHARLRSLARVFQISQHPPGDAALAVQQIGQRAVQLGAMHHLVGPAAELARSRAG